MRVPEFSGKLVTLAGWHTEIIGAWDFSPVNHGELNRDFRLRPLGFAETRKSRAPILGSRIKILKIVSERAMWAKYDLTKRES